MSDSFFGWLTDFLSRSGLWLGLVVVFLGGLALNLTPCVYPMIPVTLAFFSGQAAGALGRSVWLASCYVLGISLTYAILGVAAAKTGALFGSWLQEPLVLVALAAVIVALALSAFGLYELRPPAVLTRRLGRAWSGAGGAFLMGVVVGVVAAPCIGPFVLSLLLFVGQLANPAHGFLLFFALGLGMGLPYVILGVAVNQAIQLPKAGKWLLWVKRLLGVVLLGLALYFLRPLLFRSAPPSASAWVPYTTAALLQAQRDERPVLIDIYADWCVPCIEMDHVTFRHPQVLQALAPVTTLRLDVTSEVAPEGEELLERYQIYGAPTVLFLDRTGRERTQLRATGFLKPDELLERLRRLLE
jgi:thiol:disulfide interchange protein DsbD